MAEERRVRTSPAQCALLDEIEEESGVLYIKRYGRYGRTVKALERNGLVVCAEPDHSRLAQELRFGPDDAEDEALHARVLERARHDLGPDLLKLVEDAVEARAEGT